MKSDTRVCTWEVSQGLFLKARTCKRSSRQPHGLKGNIGHLCTFAGLRAPSFMLLSVRLKIGRELDERMCRELGTVRPINREILTFRAKRETLH